VKRSYAWAWSLLTFSLLGDALVRLRLLGVPLDRDEGEYAYFGQLILHGVPPYKTAYNFKLPGIYAVYAGILAMFGQTREGIHFGLLVANIAGCALVVLLACRLFTPVAGVVAGTTFAALSLTARLHGLAAYAEHFLLLPALAGALALRSAVESDRRRMFFASGVLFGLAFVVKQNGAAFVLFGALYALLGGRASPDGSGPARRLAQTLVLLGGALLPYAVVCLAMILAGAFQHFWFWTTVYMYRYALKRSLSDAGALVAFTSREILATTYLVVALAALGVAALIWDRAARSERRFVVLLLLCSFAGTAAGLHFRRQYFLLLAPSVALLAGIAVDAVARGLRASSAVLRIGVPVALVVLPVAHLLHAERAVLFELPPEGVARAVWGLNPFPESIEIARYLRARAAPDDRIAVIGSEPQIYFYARRPAATGFVCTIYEMMEIQPYASQMQRDMIAEIEAAKPRFVVFVYLVSSWQLRPDSDRTIFYWWKRYQQNFELVGSIGIMSDERTTYAWDAAAAGHTPTSIAVFERKRG
jgi:hypothetical protein